jgi:hypothetical protein
LFCLVFFGGVLSSTWARSLASQHNTHTGTGTQTNTPDADEHRAELSLVHENRWARAVLGWLLPRGDAVVLDEHEQRAAQLRRRQRRRGDELAPGEAAVGQQRVRNALVFYVRVFCVCLLYVCVRVRAAAAARARSAA